MSIMDIIVTIGVIATIIGIIVPLSINFKHKKEKKEELRRLYLEKACKEYDRAGTPKKFLDTLDLSDNEKANIYNEVKKLKTGRPAKSNPYQ